jgi:hypothetical protein
MKNKIKHFLVDLEEVFEEEPYDSDNYSDAKNIKQKLEKLLTNIDY